MKTKSSNKCHEGSVSFDRFQRLIRGLASVPKKEVEAEEAKWKADRALKKKPAKV